MYKNSHILAFFASITWMLFIFSAFKGFHLWYAGFVFFFWLALAALNYRHTTSLWLAKNRTRRFLEFYTVLFVVGFIADYVIGQHVADLWSYPYYTSLFDWVRLYVIIYPFGGLSILELSFFLGNLFHEKFVLLPKVHSTLAHSVDFLDDVVDATLFLLLSGGLVIYFFNSSYQFTEVVVYTFFVWTVLTTIKLALHLRHGIHWLAIFITVLFVSILLHEIPNTVAFEWKYHTAIMLNTPIMQIPLWVIIGWYVMLLAMYRLWIRVVLNRKDL